MGHAQRRRPRPHPFERTGPAPQLFRIIEQALYFADVTVAKIVRPLCCVIESENQQQSGSEAVLSYET